MNNGLKTVRSRIGVAAIVGSVMAFVAGGGIAWAVVGATSPIDTNGIIHGCYNPNTGALKLNVTGTCPTTGKHVPITWNQTGPPGPAATCAGIPHYGIDLSGCDLTGANLSNANLSQANLSNANLTGVYFVNTYLNGAVNRPGFHDCSGYWVAASPAGCV